MEPMHPNKHIREAIKYALERGWRFVKSRGHGHRECQKSV
jgi:hypothetical protein